MELRAIAAVLAVGIGVSLCVYASALLSPGSILPASDWPKLAFFYLVALGLPVAALAGAPGYALLKFKRALSWPSVLVLGLTPGVVIFVASGARDDLGLWFIGCGVAVACLTHLMSKALHPFKPRDRSEDALQWIVRRGRLLPLAGVLRVRETDLTHRARSFAEIKARRDDRRTCSDFPWIARFRRTHV